MVQEQLTQIQKEIEQEYRTHGLTDAVLEKQVQLNQLRNKHDIPDEQEYIYKNYVQ